LRPKHIYETACVLVYRVYRMGGDVLFDCELNARTEPVHGRATGSFSRVI
jgi:hypothetical protein